MLARPAQHKLVKLAKACFPPGREPNSRSGAVTTVTLAIQVAAQIGGYFVSGGRRPLLRDVTENVAGMPRIVLAPAGWPTR